MPAKQEISSERQTRSLAEASSRRTLVATRKHEERRNPGAEFAVRLADRPEEKAEAFRLRFLVFNLELHEGLESAYATGYDTDEFDEVCDHLIVQHKSTGNVVATYRMQTGITAGANLGYYSAREFDFAPFEALRGSLVEVGRAAILKEYRTFEVLNLLWKGIGRYAMQHGGRYLVGCSSLTSQDAAEGLELYRQLQVFQSEPELRTKPLAGFGLNANQNGVVPNVTAPRLLRAYLNLGARICGEPALDREFKSI
jgi:putative hemolysin